MAPLEMLNESYRRPRRQISPPTNLNVGVGELLLCIAEKTCCMVVAIKKNKYSFYGKERIESYAILKPHHGIVQVKPMEVVAKYDILK